MAVPEVLRLPAEPKRERAALQFAGTGVLPVAETLTLLTNDPIPETVVVAPASKPATPSATLFVPISEVNVIAGIVEATEVCMIALFPDPSTAVQDPDVTEDKLPFNVSSLLAAVGPGVPAVNLIIG
jgi:hypothetical protein